MFGLRDVVGNRGQQTESGGYSGPMGQHMRGAHWGTGVVRWTKPEWVWQSDTCGKS